MVITDVLPYSCCEGLLKVYIDISVFVHVYTYECMCVCAQNGVEVSHIANNVKPKFDNSSINVCLLQHMAEENSVV